MLRDIMSTQTISVQPDEKLKNVASLMVSSGIRRIVVNIGSTPLGVISARTVLREAIANTNWGDKEAKDVMRPGIFADPDTPIKAGAKIMARYGIGSLLIRGGGIVTERDIARALPRMNIPAIAVATTQVFTMPVDMTYADAASAMVNMGISHVPLTEGNRIVGVVSLRDVLKALVNGDFNAKIKEKEYYSKNPVTLPDDATVSDVANLIASKNIGSILLMEEGTNLTSDLRGIVTEWDLVRTYANSVRAYVLVKAESSKIRNVVATLALTPRVTSLSAVYGPYDILVTVDVESQEVLGTFVTQSIGNISGVRETLTMIEAEQI